ncbi:MAG: carbon-nitrogen hydrolase family protein [Candidatus Zixiibacteriota bacterium]
MKTKYRVAVVQDTPVFLDKQATIDKVCDRIKAAATEGADLVVFPEAFVSAYPDWVWVLPPSRKDMINRLYREFLENAVSASDDSLLRVGKAAKEAGVHVALGVNERNSESSNASVYNSLVYFSPDGVEIGRHRKLIPTGGERLMWSPGNGASLVSCHTEIGRLGGLICWENYMPLARVAMYQAGVQVYVAPTWDSSESWQIAMRHIAREGGMYVIGCSQAVRMSDIPDRYEFKSFYPAGREWINKGNSVVVGPAGQILAGPLEEEQSILCADIDLDAISSQKWMLDVAGHYARPDVFEFRINNHV